MTKKITIEEKDGKMIFTSEGFSKAEVVGHLMNYGEYCKQVCVEALYHSRFPDQENETKEEL